jgi:FMN phosphatase YigB (HAD superfamily)
MEFLRTHQRRCILLTAGVKEEQEQKIKVLRIRRYFRKVHIVPRPEDKRHRLQEIVSELKSQAFGISPYNVIVIGDRLDTEISKGNELGCITVRLRIPGGRHSNQMARGGPWHETPHFEVKNFEELLRHFSA